MTANPFRTVGRPWILGHRGDAARAPENTLAAVRSAIAAGADGIEVDVQELADGTLALIHDTTLQRLTGDDRATWTLTAAAARSTDAGSHFSPTFRGEPIALLDDLLALTAPWPGCLNLELKRHGHERHLIDSLAIALERADHRDRLCLTSFDLDLLRSARSRLPEVPRGWLTAHPFTDDPAPDLQVCLYAIADSALDAATIARCHEAGRAVWAWTVDDCDRARQLEAWGIDGIITNDPAALVALA